MKFIRVEFDKIELWHRISNNVVCATSKTSDQPVHTRSLIRAFASRLNNLWVLSYWLKLKRRLQSTLVKKPHCRKSHVTAQNWYEFISGWRSLAGRWLPNIDDICDIFRGRGSGPTTHSIIWICGYAFCEVLQLNLIYPNCALEGVW